MYMLGTSLTIGAREEGEGKSMSDDERRSELFCAFRLRTTETSAPASLRTFNRHARLKSGVVCVVRFQNQIIGNTKPLKAIAFAADLSNLLQHKTFIWDDNAWFPCKSIADCGAAADGHGQRRRIARWCFEIARRFFIATTILTAVQRDDKSKTSGGCE
jgi:hypothetical protein